MQKPGDIEKPLLLRLQISSRDFEDARDFVDTAKKHDESSREYEALILSAIICYGRPVTNNEGRVNDSEVAQKLIFDPASVLGADADLHMNIVRLRMKAVAHSESTHYPVELMAPFIGKPGSRGVTFSSRRWHVLNERIDLDAFRRIAETMRWYCMNRIIGFAASRSGTGSQRSLAPANNLHRYGLAR